MEGGAGRLGQLTEGMRREEEERFSLSVGPPSVVQPVPGMFNLVPVQPGTSSTWYQFNLRWYQFNLRWYQFNLRWYQFNLRWYQFNLFNLRWYQFNLRWYQFNLRWYQFNPISPIEHSYHRMKSEERTSSVLYSSVSCGAERCGLPLTAVQSLVPNSRSVAGP
ncbi:unnamed protein product [Arctogadus glacialis]